MILAYKRDIAFEKPINRNLFIWRRLLCLDRSSFLLHIPNHHFALENHDQFHSTIPKSIISAWTTAAVLKRYFARINHVVPKSSECDLELIFTMAHHEGQGDTQPVYVLIKHCWHAPYADMPARHGFHPSKSWRGADVLVWVRHSGVPFPLCLPTLPRGPL